MLLTRFCISLLLVLSFASPPRSLAQLRGSLGTIYRYSTNISASSEPVPDHLLLPALSANYSYRSSPLFELDFGGAISPTIYASNSSRSNLRNILTVGFLTYLSQRDEIRKSYYAGTPIVTDFSSPTGTSSPLERSTEDRVAEAEGILRLLARTLDSQKFLPGVGVSDRESKRLAATQDTLVEVYDAIVELLTSIDFTESVKEIAVDELKDTRPMLQRVIDQSRSNTAKIEWLELAITLLNSARAEEDILIDEVEDPASALPPIEPLFELVNPTTRLRYFGANDIYLLEDAGYETAKSYASLLRASVFREGQSYADEYNIYDNSSYGLDVRVMFFPGTGMPIDLNYDFSTSSFPNDSVYSNVEHRLWAETRIGLTASTLLFASVGFGVKDYSNPIRTVGRLSSGSNVTSTFSQFTGGVGLLQTIGERISLWAAGSLVRSPELSAYVTELGTGVITNRALRVADDEYSYDYSRLALFGLARLPYDLDLALEFSKDERVYGEVSATGVTGTDESSGANRVEDGATYSASLSRLHPFDRPFLGIFRGLYTSLAFYYQSTAATVAIYTFDEFNVSLDLSLSF